MISPSSTEGLFINIIQKENRRTEMYSDSSLPPQKCQAETLLI